MLLHLHITTLIVSRFNGLNKYVRFDMYYSWSRYFKKQFRLIHRDVKIEDGAIIDIN